MKKIYRRKLARTLALPMFLAFAANAQQIPQGEPVTDAVVRDVEFGVSARHFGLERQVEMLQWQAARDGYAQVWSDQVIASDSFAPGHANPGEFPLRSQRWIASPVTIALNVSLSRMSVSGNSDTAFSRRPASSANRYSLFHCCGGIAQQAPWGIAARRISIRLLLPLLPSPTSTAQRW